MWNLYQFALPLVEPVPLPVDVLITERVPVEAEPPVEAESLAVRERVEKETVTDVPVPDPVAERI
jgi:hypothetical protein